jgi:hypothetical protein
MPSKLSLFARGSRKGIYKAVDLIKDEIKAHGNVFVKPNLSASRNAYSNISLEAVEAVIDFFNVYFAGLSVTVGESTGCAHLAGMCTRKLLGCFGSYGLEKKYRNVRGADLDGWQDFWMMPVKTAHGRGKW